MLYIPGMCVISLHTQTKLLLFYDINPLSLLLYSTIENNNKKKNRGRKWGGAFAFKDN